MDELYEEQERASEDQNEEEAHFYFVVSDFEELIQKYGVDFILSKVRYPIYMKLYHYFNGL